MELVFATNNKHKIEEVQQLLQGKIRLLSLKEIGCTEELPETGNTLEANARQKASYVYKKFRTDCFADDTGLEIEALNGRPGVYSARYARLNEPFGQAGEEKSAEKNVKKVLEELKGIQDRKALFKTIISLIINNKEFSFEGKIKGNISTEIKGNKGFGYDPVFIPNGYDKSFAEMSLEEKNKISHRAIAVKKLAEFLNALKS